MAKDENKESEIRGDEQEIVDQRLPVWRPQDADREYYRYETKKRIQHYTVPPQTIFRPAKPTPTIRDAEHKRVAVYARVSTKSKEQVSSIENQTKYYTEKIAKTPNWDLAEIYSDEGKSGTSKKWRPEFKRMLEDASKKKMDLIVCASVSRFARNISDLIEEVRKLRTTNPSNPVGVYFETEDLYTLDPNINERLQMQGLFAEWESGNKSRRMILSYDQRICTGQFPLSDLLGLRHTIEGGFIIEEEEAKTVKYIFLATLCGYTAEEIAEVLTDKQRPTLRGRTEWTASMVKAIMENERRWGDLEVRKRVVIDYKEKVTAKNEGLREGAYIPHYHEGIVSPEIARAAHIFRFHLLRQSRFLCHLLYESFLQFAGSLLNLRQVTVQNPFRQKIVVQNFVMFLQISSPHLRPSAESHFLLLRQLQVRKIVISHHRVCDFAHRFDSFRL